MPRDDYKRRCPISEAGGRLRTGEGVVLAPGKYFGEMERDRVIDHLMFSESRYAGGMRIPKHAHEQPFFCLILKGDSSEVVGTERRVNRPSTLVFHPAGESHANEWHGSGGRCFHIEIGSQRWDKLARDVPLVDQPAVFRSGIVAALAQRAYREFVTHDAFTPLALEGLVWELLAATARQLERGEGQMPLWLRRVHERVQEEFHERLTVEELAAEVGVHPAHLSRTFRQHFGETPGGYVRRLRIDAAARLLVSTSLSIAEIARRVGCADQSHFTKSFARQLNTTPGAYRRARMAQR